MPNKRRCCVCGKMSTRWQRINGSPWHCYDGCYETTGRDRRTIDGQPAWEQSRRVDGRFGFGPWNPKRMKPNEPR